MSSHPQVCHGKTDRDACDSFAMMLWTSNLSIGLFLNAERLSASRAHHKRAVATCGVSTEHLKVRREAALPFQDGTRTRNHLLPVTPVG
jgi:hypothetical protein